MEPLAPHEKLYVDDEFIDEDENHGGMACVDCHGGNPQDDNWQTAHRGVVKDPTYPEATVCADCHEEASANYQNNLHISNRPMMGMVLARTGSNAGVREKLNMAGQKHCADCHSSCGQCHVSRPTNVGGGLLSGHLFQKKPPMREVCTACHGSRVGNEYMGKDDKCNPDVHFEKGRMECEKCHPAEQMHGDGKAYAHRYEVENGPRCINCHQDIYGEKGQNIATHTQHKDKASCYVCHAQSYTNCVSCHVKTAKDGRTFYEVESHSVNFKIGMNHRRSAKYPEKFVVLRHVPVDQGSFDHYVKSGLSRFDDQPTWKMATPHNIRRKTSQNASCNSCHGNASLFLLKGDVRSKYSKSNQAVIVSPEDIPAKIDNGKK